MDKITSFTGDYRFLSNFWPVNIVVAGHTYSSVEHAYQASKTFHPLERIKIRNATTPGQAKRLGKNVSLRADWESVKVRVMRELLRKKFSQPKLKRKLINTGKAELIESNTWGDRFWGVCDGQGKNMLGLLLMEVREELREEGGNP